MEERIKELEAGLQQISDIVNKYWERYDVVSIELKQKALQKIVARLKEPKQ